MKTNSLSSRRPAGFTLVEVMISMTIVVMVLALSLSTFLFGLRTMYKDCQRLATNASLRSFMAQISKETLDASYFYLMPDYKKLDGTVNLTSDPAVLVQTEDFTDPAYDKWVAHGDCLVLITKTSQYRTTEIRQIRIYYRLTDSTNQATLNDEAKLYYYSSPDWGEGSPDDGDSGTYDGNGHPLSDADLTTELNAIDLNSDHSSETQTGPATLTRTGTKLLNRRTKGRLNTGVNLYPMFSSESPTNSGNNGFVSINVEFINGANVGTNMMLSSSSFNYTISPRR
jgi:prepilin-type N-terminal cleavage/methylation domain-containing protein